ncbi:MAG: dual specificity protein phosphatase family protein [Planctomycetota bacterium]|jgi:atypical dual specificity phosphatase|nr:dual specificity protein phosphatase family protein [Planctomycetota bacterium]
MPANFSFVIPGKLAGCARPGGRAGDIRSDLAGLVRQGIAALVTLTEEALDPAAVRDVGLDVLHLPVPDFAPPTLEQIARFVAYVDERNRAGGAVAVHCGAGCGRTGTMLACYLASRGKTAGDAIMTVRRERPGSVETPEQELRVREFAFLLGREA